MLEDTCASALLAQLWSLLELLDSKLLCPQNSIVVICQLEFKALLGKKAGARFRNGCNLEWSRIMRLRNESMSTIKRTPSTSSRIMTLSKRILKFNFRIESKGMKLRSKTSVHFRAEVVPGGWNAFQLQLLGWLSAYLPSYSAPSSF